MTTEIREIFFSLLRNALSGRRMTDEEKVDIKEKISPEVLNDLFGLADGQDLAHFIGYALINNALIGRGDEMYDRFYAAQFVAMCRYENINNAFVQAAEQFESAQIEYLPLKGAVMRRYYPQPWMRTSSDIDILVHNEDFDKVSKIMSALGFEMKSHDKKDASFMKNGAHIEIHFYLIKDKSIAFLQPNFLWETAERIGCRCVLGDDIFYAYHVEHMKRHFSQGGCGVRFFIDLWLLNISVGDDMTDMRNERLAESGALDFEKGCMRLCKVWFGNEPHDDFTQRLEAYVFSAGVYGTIDNWALAQGLQSGSTSKSLWSRIWMPYEKLCWSYPQLEGRRYLQPYYEARRIFAMFAEGRLGRSVAELKANRSADLSASKDIGDMLKELGIKK